MRTHTQELTVGVFVVLAISALFFLALRVSGLAFTFGGQDTYALTAHFQNIGGLSKNAKVTLSGVTIGKVTDIQIDPKFLNAKVSMEIDSDMNQISDDAYASILTAGLLGEQYIGIEPGANDKYLQNGDEITLTQSALVLEDLISKFVFNKATDDKASAANNTAAKTKAPAQSSSSNDAFSEEDFGNF